VRATDHGSRRGDRRVVDELVVALGLGDIEGVLARLAPDVVCVADGGAERKAARRPVVGASRVARFLINLARRDAAQITVTPVGVNGDAGVILALDDAVDLVVAFELDVDRVSAIRIVRNPDKLGRISDRLGFL